MKKIIFSSIIIFAILVFSCKNKNNTTNPVNEPVVNNLAQVKLEADLSSMTYNQKQVIELLIKASDYIDSIYMFENYENYKIVLDTIKDANLRQRYVINAGPWDRFSNNKPFIKGVGQKPLGANYYPKDIKQLEFYEYKDDCKESPYTFIRRNEKGQLYCIPFNVMLKKYNDSIVSFMNKAASFAQDSAFAAYLKQRAIDLQTDNYVKSDSMWVLMTNSKIDFVIGPIYVTDDKLFNIKTDHHSYLLIKNAEWTKKTEKYNKWLRFLQKALPVPEKYRAEEPGTNSSISVYDAIYLGGSGKCGGTMISLVLPLEPQIQMKYGIRNIQFKNIIEKKFDAVTKPIAEIAIDKNQRSYISSEAFFENAILYEIANSLGIRNTVNGKGTVRKALKNYYIVTDYIKNYIFSLFLAEKLSEVGEITGDLKNNYYTFVANTLRLIRFGTQDDYGLSNLLIFNYFVENKAIVISKNYISMDYDKMKEATNQLLTKIIILQGDGDYESVVKFVDTYKNISPELQNIIDEINNSNIPTDMYVIQGKSVLKF